MDCREFRRDVGADPGHPGAEALAHRDSCPACAEYLRQTLALDERILGALRVPVPEGARAAIIDAAAVAARRRRRIRNGRGLMSYPVIDRRRWIALAASIAAGVMVGSLLWVTGPRPSLAQDLVKHMGHEPGAMATTGAADPAEVAEVLERAGVRLGVGAGSVSYANTCRFRGDKVPHLVVQTASGPVTVMVLRHERVAAPVRFDEDGYAGTIVPAGPGSIAVIGPQPAVDLGTVAQQVKSALTWNEG